LARVVPPVSPHNVAAEVLESEAVFKGMKVRMESDLATAKKINGVFLYVILKNGKPAAKWSK